MITSRPDFLLNFHGLATCNRVELLGFTKHDYIHKYYENATPA